MCSLANQPILINLQDTGKTYFYYFYYFVSLENFVLFTLIMRVILHKNAKCVLILLSHYNVNSMAKSVVAVIDLNISYNTAD